jgi:hypothetical protein
MEERKKEKEQQKSSEWYHINLCRYVQTYALLTQDNRIWYNVLKAVIISYPGPT